MPPKPRQNWLPSWLLLVMNSRLHLHDQRSSQSAGLNAGGGTLMNKSCATHCMVHEMDAA